MTIADKFSQVRDTIRAEYLKHQSNPWVVAFSGGKDSTLLLHITWEVLASMDKRKLTRPIYIIGNDTLVESPLVINHLKDSMNLIKEAAQQQDLPIRVQMTKPFVDQTFWVNVIGKGYIPPTRNFRWCTDRMKITPTNQIITQLTKRYKSTLLLVGTRKSESQNRRRTMEKYGVLADNVNPHSLIKNCYIFSPLADLSSNDVWEILIQRTPPWGGSHKNLISLYRSAGGGDCPLVLTKEDAPSCGTTSPRFGCWTCTVVKKDRSMRGVITSEHEDGKKLEALADFRDWLIELREDNENRMSVRRNGKTQLRENGNRIMGPFGLEIRREILKRLEALQGWYGEQLISPAEIELIHDIWRQDEINERARQRLLESVGAVVD